MQADVNKVEAGSSTIHKRWGLLSGWCAGQDWLIIRGRSAAWVGRCAGWHPIAPPPLDTGTLLTLLFGMLGLGLTGPRKR